MEPTGFVMRNPFFFFFKKHFCAECKTELTKIRTSKIVSSYSEEAEDYPFFNGETSYEGDARFVFWEFVCSNCNKHISIKAQRQQEKEAKSKNVLALKDKIMR